MPAPKHASAVLSRGLRLGLDVLEAGLKILADEGGKTHDALRDIGRHVEGHLGSAPAAGLDRFAIQTIAGGAALERDR